MMLLSVAVFFCCDIFTQLFVVIPQEEGSQEKKKLYAYMWWNVAEQTKKRCLIICLIFCSFVCSLGNNPLEAATPIGMPVQWLRFASVQFSLVCCYHYDLHLSHTKSLLIDFKVCHFHCERNKWRPFHCGFQRCISHHHSSHADCFHCARIKDWCQHSVFRCAIIQYLSWCSRANRHPFLNV